MLVVLDEIQEGLKDEKTPLWDRLNHIRFWALSLEKFVFIYPNP